MNIQKLSLVYKVIFLTVLTFSSLVIFAQNQENGFAFNTKLNEETTVCFKSSIWDLDIKTWDKDELKVEYYLEIEAKTEELKTEFIEKLKDEIKKQLAKRSDNAVDAIIGFKSYNSSNGKVSVQFRDDKKKYSLKKLKGKVRIYTSKTNNVEIKSSFVDVDLESISANVKITISSAGLMMNDCENLELKASFSKNILVGNVQKADLKLSSSSIELKKNAGDLNLKASFSDVEIENIDGKANLELSSSTFETGDLKTLKLKGSFVRKCKFNNIESAELILSSSNFEVNSINDLKLDKISFSTVTANEIANLSITTASSSKFFIEKLGVLTADKCSFTSFKIKVLEKRFIADTNSGNVIINSVENGFDKIDIDGDFLTTNIHTAEDCNFVLSAQLSFPNYKFEKLNIIKQDKENSKATISAYKGKSESSSSKINLNCNSCRITVD